MSPPRKVSVISIGTPLEQAYQQILDLAERCDFPEGRFGGRAVYQVVVPGMETEQLFELKGRLDDLEAKLRTDARILVGSLDWLAVHIDHQAIAGKDAWQRVLTTAPPRDLKSIIAALKAEKAFRDGEHEGGDLATPRVQAPEDLRVKSGTPPPWSCGDVKILAESLGLPDLDIDGRRVSGADAWQRELDSASAEMRAAIYAALSAEADARDTAENQGRTEEAGAAVDNLSADAASALARDDLDLRAWIPKAGEGVRPWSAGDIFHAAKGGGFPRVQLGDGTVVEGEAAWCHEIETADSVRLAELHATLGEEDDDVEEDQAADVEDAMDDDEEEEEEAEA